MNKLDVTHWREYQLEDLFQFVNSKAYHKKDIVQTDGSGLNYITRSKFNNGLNCKVIDNQNYEKNPAGTISFGAENANFFYQEEEYITGNKMYYIASQSLSKNTNLFLKTILESKFTNNFSFSDGMIPDRIKKEKILLPSIKNEDSSYSPDWEYMDNYIEKLQSDIQEKIRKLSSLSVSKHKLHTDKWKTFKIGDLFPKIIQPKVYHSKELKEETTGIPYVVRSKYNNGIKFYVHQESGMQLNPAGTISFGAENATFFYQPKAYVSGRDIYYIDTTYLSQKVCLFITSCLQTITNKYSYNYGMFPELVKNETIKLPVDNKGNPDWKYMEKYIEKVEFKVKTLLDNIRHLTNCN